MRKLFASAAFAFLLCTGICLAQSPPLGAEFQVNTFTAGVRQVYGAAMDPAGNFVVSWYSPGDGSDYGVFLRRFDASGAPQGGEIQVNAYTTGRQVPFALASDASGRFVVVWQDFARDGDLAGVFARRYDEAGNALGDEFPVNTYTTGFQMQPSVASDAGGNFVVVWDSYGSASSGQDGDLGGVYGQRFDNAGKPLGGEFRVNTYTTGNQFRSSVAMAPGGSFVVTWYGPGQSIGGAVWARRYDGSGTPLGDPFAVNVGTAGLDSSVAMDASGGFVVVWQAATGGIWGRRFNGSGTPLGVDFRINSYTTPNQVYPRVAMDRAGNFIAVWETMGGQDGSDSGVFGQRYDATGLPVGQEFQINTYTTSGQTRPRVALNDSGSFGVTWTSFKQVADWGVFARRSELSAAESIAVDAHASGSTVSNVNGVLEPGERVVVEPGWTNTGSTDLTLTGFSPSWTGPPGASYTLNGSSADYGTLAAGMAANCHDATGTCYEVTVSNPSTRPSAHWDAQLQENLSAATPKTWALHVGGSFTDVPSSQPFYKKIETLLHTGITAGCTPTAYCPGESVSRAQMAIFIAKGIAGSGAAIPASGKVGANDYGCKAGGVSLFADVTPTDIFCKQVHYIAAQNVTLGCSATQYCPGDTVTRLQMAAFVAKAIVAPQGGAGVPVTYGPDPATGLSYSCDAGSPNTHFSDVPATDVFCKHVHYLWAKGIIAGCSATQYCPADPVTRDAMAKFLSNAFVLQLYGP